jgi:hypothetical protein
MLYLIIDLAPSPYNMWRSVLDVKGIKYFYLD